MSNRIIPARCHHCQTEWREGLSVYESHASNCPSHSGPLVRRHQVLRGIWLGDLQARSAVAWCGVVGILSQKDREDYDSALPVCPGTPVFDITHEDRTPGLLAKCPPAWDFVDKILAEGGRSILFHCLGGASRSPAALTGYLVARRGFAPAEAADLVTRRRPAAVFMAECFQQEIGELKR